MYDGSEYLQNILLKKSKNIYIINIKSQHVFLSRHAMKNLQFLTKKIIKKKTLKKVLNVLHDDVACQCTSYYLRTS
jgi:hypothetical protein